MQEIVRHETTARSSRVVIYNGVVYVGGMTPYEDSGDIKAQTKQTLERIDKYLAMAGTDKSRLLTAQIWLKDIANDFKGMNEIWNAWTAPNASPTRATAQCEMADPDLRVEIIVTAAVKS